MAKPKIEMRDPAALRPHPKNPRTHSDESIAHVAALIERYGFTQPILVDEDGVVLAGHKRRLAALQRGDKTVPVIALHGLDDAAKLAYVIADNQATFTSPWDYELLGVNLGELYTLEFDMALLGFSDIQADALRTDDQIAASVYEEQHFWPVIRHKVQPRVYERWREMFAKLDGETDGDKIVALLDTLDG